MIKPLKHLLIIIAVLICSIPFTSYSYASTVHNAFAFPVLTGELSLDQTEGFVGSEVSFTATGLVPNKPVQLSWMTVDGSYDLDGIYTVIGPKYEEKEIILLTDKVDDQGNWSGTFIVPKGFGGDHTLYVSQGNVKVAQNTYFVAPKFTMQPESGPVGTEITITAEGIGWTNMESNWQLSYDNKLTGLISAVSTEGTATAKIRASGEVGKHNLTIWHGYLGIPYINHEQAPNSYLPVPSFTFEVTDEEPIKKNAVGPIPKAAADGGVQMPNVEHKPEVSVVLNKNEATVGESVNLTAEGLPPGEGVEVIWYTMVGNRVTAAGFSEKAVKLGQTVSDSTGKLSYAFVVPDDLGGVPHRIELKVGDELYGGTYLRILPTIVSISPTSGPSGTEVTIEIKGSGWTEFDNAYYLTYDNAYIGYMCSFNSQGTLKFKMTVNGAPGHHLIDLYPGIYRGQKKVPDIYLAPQLTYSEDHPGSAMPVINLGFDITR
ncbi:IPT/TIG domain-containing protein [Bacillus sp. Marseille-P3661]|uniref:IPT/TIG domain-containing protein n=1 Tax=Bacillus sp. Marseille-P3661 TaxID=1936234 RepID=UPI000C83DC22|nr:IPT/TIG domain-containing protein [Bacillus sp. Marseille-P3661]